MIRRARAAAAASAVAASLVSLAGCGSGASAPEVAVSRSDVGQFLQTYNELYQRLDTVAQEADWRASIDISEQHTGERIGAESALSAFRGSRFVIERARAFLAMRQELTDLEFRQLDKILLNAAESPGTIPEIVLARIEAEARLSSALDSFAYCAERAAGKCVKPASQSEIGDVLAGSRDLAQRRRYWEIAKQPGPPLKRGLAELRDLRNRTAKELGYTSYFHLKAADYGMSVDELLQLMDQTVADLKPLYDQLHLYARRKLAERYKQPVPARLPVHWTGNVWGQSWPGVAPSADFDEYMKGRQPRWIIEQAERFYTSLGMPPLPKSFWEKSDLYQLRPDSPRRKRTQASARHVNLDHDVRALMSVAPTFEWFTIAHYELGQIYYYLSYSDPKVPVVLREGLNRAFHEAVGELMASAGRQEPYLRQIGLLPRTAAIDPIESLLGEALDDTVVFLPFAAGAMTRFEHELYERRLPVDQFNKRWWELATQYQGIEPPSQRGEEFCDACTKRHIFDAPAQYYDYAIAYLIKYQLHDYIARRILNQDPRKCNYYGNREVGKWLTEILALGATRDWRQVIKEKTGEDLSSRAVLDYFKPLAEFLANANAESPAP